MMENPLPSIQAAKHARQLGWTFEALKKSLERNIAAEDVEAALNSSKAVILRNDPTDKSPSCLVLGWDSGGRAIHAVVAYARMLLVTIYEPRPPRWQTPYEREGHSDE